jgi:hypothetical protein
VAPYEHRTLVEAATDINRRGGERMTVRCSRWEFCMHFTRKNTALAASLALASSALVGGPAMADPNGGGGVELVCGTETFEVTVAGNGEWTPAHDANSTTVWQPVAFANQVGEVTAADDGAVLASFADDTFTAKKGNRTGQGSLKCRFSAVEGPVLDSNFPDEIDGVYYSFSGDVWVKTV